MSPYKDPTLLKEFLYIMIGFVGAFISIIRGMLGGKKVTVLSSLGMIVIGGFIGWSAGNITDNAFIAGICGAMSMEIMHSMKEYGPQIIRNKMKIFFNIKDKDENK